jgi:type III pantothenate kinase
MQSGVFWGYVSMIEGMTARIKQEVESDMLIVATGGLASMFADATDTIDHWDQDLTLRGLLGIYRRNLS